MPDTPSNEAAPPAEPGVLRRYHLTYYRGLFGRTARRRCPHSDLVPVTGDQSRQASGRGLWCRGCRRRIDGPSWLPESRSEETRVWPGHADR